MQRLPKSFEESVLNKHGIFWHKGMRLDEQYWKVYTFGEDKMFQMTTEYEIAAISLEAIMKSKIGNFRFYYGMKGYSLFDKCHYSEKHKYNQDDENFCECIFKVVEEIWGNV